MKVEELLEVIEIDENKGAQKSSHTTNPTSCFDVRRSGSACGICGSYNLVEQGVRFCVTCGKEEEDLRQFSSWWSKEKREPICKCPDIDMFLGRIFKSSPHDSYYISKCLDCGAIDSVNFCPNCATKQNRSFGSSGTWKHWDGRIKCSRCGFSITDPIICSIGGKKNKAQGKLGTKKAKKIAAYMSKRKMKRLAAKNRPHPNLVKR
jgi:hypothetical protein